MYLNINIVIIQIQIFIGDPKYSNICVHPCILSYFPRNIIHHILFLPLTNKNQNFTTKSEFMTKQHMFIDKFYPRN